jgi:rSAM/selenodomain-associated transferase 1
MNRAFVKAFEEGAGKVVLVGTDCPGLTADILRGAFGILHRNTLVLGPARDGGYYLLGLREPQPSLFADISWGTPEVLDQTVEVAGEIGLSMKFVDTLEDVDRIEDLTVWEKCLRP